MKFVHHSSLASDEIFLWRLIGLLGREEETSGIEWQNSTVVPRQTFISSTRPLKTDFGTFYSHVVCLVTTSDYLDSMQRLEMQILRKMR